MPSQLSAQSSLPQRLTLKDGKVWRETDYFAAPFEAPDWRRSYVDIENVQGQT